MLEDIKKLNTNIGNISDEISALNKKYGLPELQEVRLPVVSRYLTWESNAAVEFLLSGLFLLGQFDVVSASWACVISGVCFAAHHIFVAHELRGIINQLQNKYVALTEKLAEINSYIIDHQRTEHEAELGKMRAEIGRQKEGYERILEETKRASDENIGKMQGDLADREQKLAAKEAQAKSLAARLDTTESTLLGREKRVVDLESQVGGLRMRYNDNLMRIKIMVQEAWCHHPSQEKFIMKQPTKSNSGIKRALMSFFWDTFCKQPMRLVYDDEPEELEKRLKAGVLPVDYNEYGESLLKQAVGFVRPRIITLLLQWDADPNWPHHADTSRHPRICAIDKAYIHNGKALLKLLLTYGANYEHIRKVVVNGIERIIWLDSVCKGCYELYESLRLARAQFAHARCKLDYEQAAENFENAKNLLGGFIAEERDERILADPEYQTDPAYLEDYILRHKECEVKILECRYRASETHEAVDAAGMKTSESDPLLSELDKKLFSEDELAHLEGLRRRTFS